MWNLTSNGSDSANTNATGKTGWSDLPARLTNQKGKGEQTPQAKGGAMKTEQ